MQRRVLVSDCELSQRENFIIPLFPVSQLKEWIDRFSEKHYHRILTKLNRLGDRMFAIYVSQYA